MDKMTTRRKPRPATRLLWAVLLASCGPSPTSVVMRPENAVIMPVSVGPVLAKPCRTAPTKVAGFWVPTPRQIARLEAGLPDAVNPLLNRVVKNAGKISYHRQYIGLTRPDGRKAIYINAFASDLINGGAQSSTDTVRWRVNPVDYCDGFLGFWSIEFDVETGAFSGFAHNGRA